MLLKLLFTLWVLAGNSSSTNHAVATNDVVQLKIEVDKTLLHYLCNDFVPIVTNSTCKTTLFQSAEEVDFMSINNQTMVLKPTSSDLPCPAITGYICFPRTYQLTINAFNPSNSSLITHKRFAITLQGTSKAIIETLVVVLVILGGSMVCLLSICIDEQLLRLRRQIVQREN